jgi:hypothetical protein
VDDPEGWKKVYAAVLEADAVGSNLYSGCVDEVTRVRLDCQNQRIIELLTNELLQGAAVGEVGALDTTVIITSSLEEAVRECKQIDHADSMKVEGDENDTTSNFGLSDEAKILLKTAEIVLQV